MKWLMFQSKFKIKKKKTLHIWVHSTLGKSEIISLVPPHSAIFTTIQFRQVSQLWAYLLTYLR